MCDGGPLYSQALGTLAVQGGGAGHRGAAQGSSNLGVVARLADFGWGGAAVVGGVHVDAKLREETAHSNVAVEHAGRKSHVLALRGIVWANEAL